MKLVSILCSTVHSSNPDSDILCQSLVYVFQVFFIKKKNLKKKGI